MLSLAFSTNLRALVGSIYTSRTPHSHCLGHYGHVTLTSAYTAGDTLALAAINRGKLMNSASMVTSTSAALEAAAVALAIRMADGESIPAYVVSDSQDHGLVWCPAHTGQAGNEPATSETNFTEILTTGEVTRRSMLKRQPLDRKVMAPPQKKLNVQQAHDWCRLQTDTYLHLQKLHTIYPERYGNVCPWYGGTPTLPHITYICLQTPVSADSGHTRRMRSEWWEDSQLATLGEDRRAAAASGVLEEGPRPR
ncbi:hypothetical protein HPB50_001377 [Hyalomma asiaticum]|uniref:Uncharacterized protein n=1 Tax=Hyalomma asiaticum TaxID=266040 RepID=A0ACB7T9P1_HYAAI|nr:hypothetical protein HPB50_001377 [Hyalomma asiaticum]